MTTSDGSRSYKCKFCKRSFKGKIIYHLIRSHKDTAEIVKIISLPSAKKLKGRSLCPEQKLMLQLISQTVREENFQDIITAPEGETVKTVYRARKNKSLKDYKVCPICHSTFKKHMEKMHNNSQRIGGHSSKLLHNLAIRNKQNSRASNRLSDIYSRLNNDSIANVAKYDDVIISYGNWQSLKHRTQEHYGVQLQAYSRCLA